MVDQIRIDEVVVGERARKDYGDLDSLMASICEHGLLQPIGLAPGNDLLFGGRRLEACRRLGLTVIDVTRPSTQNDALSLIKAERDENTCRKDMTPEELVDIGLRVESLEREKGRQNQAAAAAATNAARWGDPVASAPSEPERPVEHHDTNAEVAEALGIGRATYKRMKTVVTTARNEDEEPEVREVAREALHQMNAGRLSPRAGEAAVREARNPMPKPEPTSYAIPPSPKYGGNRRKHADVIEQMTIKLSAFDMVAAEIAELDSTVTAEKAAHLLGDLSRSIRSLNQIKNLLKERTNS